MKLTQEEKRIKIAQHLGRQPEHVCCTHGTVSATRIILGESGSPYCPWCKAELDFEDCPDYFADLNAMHEAEKAIEDANEWAGDEDSPEAAYFWQIHRVVGSHDDWAFLTATAAQRAEAFGLTLKLWEAGE